MGTRVARDLVVGVVGLGKLGLPLAVTLALEGFSVIGHDRDSSRMTPLALAEWELDRTGSGSLLDEWRRSGSTDLRFMELSTLVDLADCILVAVETPHAPLYEGVTALPETRADFDYTALRGAVSEIVAIANGNLAIGIISTVLPGTTRREILPLTGDHSLVYCPQFIAMGRVSQDFLDPEFILIGTDSDDDRIESVFKALAPTAPTLRMHFESAELTKTIYNTYISTKVAISNLIQQISGVTGADAKDVFSAVQQAGKRITSSSYMGPGLGDGGPCHPRDNIALSWLVRSIGLKSDLFTTVMDVRYEHTVWLAEEFLSAAGDRPLVILGMAYKPGVPIETGSAAVLLAQILRNRGVEFKVVTTSDDGKSAYAEGEARPHAYFIGCPEPEFYKAEFADGSIVFDPWYRAVPADNIEVVHPGSTV